MELSIKIFFSWDTCILQILLKDGSIDRLILSLDNIYRHIWKQVMSVSVMLCLSDLNILYNIFLVDELAKIFPFAKMSIYLLPIKNLDF